MGYPRIGRFLQPWPILVGLVIIWILIYTIYGVFWWLPKRAIANITDDKERWRAASDTMRVLDLGCGVGLNPSKTEPPDWQFIGLDVGFRSVSEAHLNFRHREFVCAAAEHMPFSDLTFDRVF